MPLFQYSAVNSDGTVEQGTTVGPSLESALQKLSGRGLQVTNISAASLDPNGHAQTGSPPAEEFKTQSQGQPRATTQNQSQADSQPKPGQTPPPSTDPRSVYDVFVVGALSQHVPLVSLEFFFRQYASMVGAGVNPTKSLDTLSKQTDNGKLGSILREARDHTNAGRPLSACFQRYPEVFTPMMLSVLRSGEANGNVEEQCKILANYIHQEVEIKRTIKRETFYPKLLIVGAFLILFFANIIIAGIGNPGFAISSIILNPVVWIFIIIGGIAIFLYNRIFSRVSGFREVFDSIALKVPYLGPTIHQFAMARFGQAFGALYKSGVGLPEATILAADACGNFALRRQIYGSEPKLKEGMGITQAWAETRAFNPVVLDMTATGEETGMLDVMLGKVSEYYEQEAQLRAKKFATVLGFVVYMIVAIMIGMTVINFYSGYSSKLIDLADPSK